MAASDIRREDVLKAIADYDRREQKAFLDHYEFGKATQYRLVFGGKFYDSKAIVGVAHGLATGEYWTGKKAFGGVGGTNDAVPILTNLGFFVDDGTLFALGDLKVDKTHGKPAPYQYLVALWAFARARDGYPRMVPFDDVPEQLTDLLAPFAIAKTAPAPSMPWAALTRVPKLWDWDGEGLSVVTDGSDVKRSNIVGGLAPTPYAAAQRGGQFLDAAAAVVSRLVGNHPAFPGLLKELGLNLPADPNPVDSNVVPEVADAVSALEELTRPRRNFGRRLSAAENRAIEEQAVAVVRKHYEEVLGYATKDVGATESYDIHATKGDSVIKVEVKGTTSDGSEIVLTANEVALHLAEHPNTALAVVRRIVLDRSGDTPVATGGELVLERGWELDQSRLKPIAYRYPTGL